MWPFEAAYVTSYKSSIETKPVSHLVFEIFNWLWKFMMTSPLTSRNLDRHYVYVWIIWTNCAVDDYAKIWSNSDKNWRRRSILKGVKSRLWRHRISWRHRLHHNSIASGHFPIGSQLTLYLPWFPEAHPLGLEVNWQKTKIQFTRPSCCSRGAPALSAVHRPIRQVQP